MANGDSGKWGADMNAIKRHGAKQLAAYKARPAFTARGNANTKAMLTGKYQMPNIKGRIKKAAGRMLGL